MYINEYQSNRRGSVLRHDKPRQVMRVGVTDTYLTAGTRTQYLLQYDKLHAVILPDWLQHSSVRVSTMNGQVASHQSTGDTAVRHARAPFIQS